MSLTYNEKTEKFIWVGPELSETATLCRDCGFVVSKPGSERAGHGNQMFFSDNVFSAIALMNHAHDLECCALTIEVCNRYLTDFDTSFSKTTDYMPPAPRGCVYLPYQRAGIEYSLGRQHTLIGDAPGLGKTIQAIGFCNAIEAQRVLVICPAAVRINWTREIYKWSTVVGKQDHKIWNIQTGEDGVNPFAHFNVISYHLASNDRIYQTIMSMEWAVVILDEAHYLKTPHSLRTKTILGGIDVTGIVERARRVMALTGTPLPNRPREAFTLAKALCWDAIDWMNHEQFQSKFNPVNEMPNGYQLEERFNLLELQSRMRCNYMVRRLKEDVLEDLPDKRYELSYIDPGAVTAAIRRVLKKEKMLDFSVDDLINPNPTLFGQISTIRREMGEAMVPGIFSHIKMLIDGGVDKLIVFAHHNSVMDQLMDLMSGTNHIHAVRLSGKTPKKQRQEAIDSFQDDPGINVFLGQLTAAGVGITLTASSHVLLAEASWVPGENEQAVDRAHRIGQKSAVLAQYLVVEGSISEKILSRAIEKHHVVHTVLDKGVGER